MEGNNSTGHVPAQAVAASFPLEVNTRIKEELSENFIVCHMH